MCQVFAGQDPDRYAMTTRRVRLNGQSTSIRLENTFWAIIDEIAADDASSTPGWLSALHAEVLEREGDGFNFASLLRCACLIHLEKDRLRPARRLIAAE
jgi:predicted DNA-binding ribbon-helix-helix protein